MRIFTQFQNNFSNTYWKGSGLDNTSVKWQWQQRQGSWRALAPVILLLRICDSHKDTLENPRWGTVFSTTYYLPYTHTLSLEHTCIHAYIYHTQTPPHTHTHRGNSLEWLPGGGPSHATSFFQWEDQWASSCSVYKPVLAIPIWCWVPEDSWRFASLQ